MLGSLIAQDRGELKLGWRALMWRGIYTPNPKIVVELLGSKDSGHTFSKDCGNVWILRIFKHLWRKLNNPQKPKVPKTPKILSEILDLFAESTPKLSHVMCKCNGVSHRFVRSSWAPFLCKSTELMSLLIVWHSYTKIQNIKEFKSS